MITKSEEYAIFTSWWKTEQLKFHCGQFSEKEIAYSAWLAGIDSCTEFDVDLKER